MRFTSVAMRGLAPLVLSAAACGVAADTSDDDGASQADPPFDAAPGSVDAAPVPFDAGDPPPTVYRGGLEATPPVLFGGGGFCEYTITLRDIAVEVEMREGGEVTGAAVADLSVEDKVPPCTLETIPPAVQHYALLSDTPTAGGVALTMMGTPANNPTTTLVVDLTPNGADYAAHLTWKRIDQAPPLDWEVVADLLLSPEPAPSAPAPN